MSDRKSKRVSGDVFRNEHAATMCSRGTTIVISPKAWITSPTHNGCSRCNAATQGDGAVPSKPSLVSIACSFFSIITGYDDRRRSCLEAIVYGLDSGKVFWRAVEPSVTG